MKCKNYRPISLLPIFSKIIEKIMYAMMYDFLEKNNLLHNKQFGLCRANGIFSKLCHYVPKTTMLSVYYAFFILI